MLKAVELYELTRSPRINDIDTMVLQDFYTYYLMPFIFEYSIEYKNGDKNDIKLFFNEENFCHLLGIESIARGSVSYNKLTDYKGLRGWNNINSGKITINHLKSLNKKKFKSTKAKFVYFYLIPKLLEIPLLVNYGQLNVSTSTQINCEILFYNQYNNAIIHLGITKHDNFNYYIPRTFFVEKLTPNNNVDIYTINQPKISLVKKSKTIMI